MRAPSKVGGHSFLIVADDVHTQAGIAAATVSAFCQHPNQGFPMKTYISWNSHQTSMLFKTQKPNRMKDLQRQRVEIQDLANLCYQCLVLPFQIVTTASANPSSSWMSVPITAWLWFAACAVTQKDSRKQKRILDSKQTPCTDQEFVRWAKAKHHNKSLQQKQPGSHEDDNGWVF